MFYYASVITNLRGFGLDFECNVCLLGYHITFWNLFGPEMLGISLNSFVGMVGDWVFMLYMILFFHWPLTVIYSRWESFHSLNQVVGVHIWVHHTFKYGIFRTDVGYIHIHSKEWEDCFIFDHLQWHVWCYRSIVVQW